MTSKMALFLITKNLLFSILFLFPISVSSQNGNVTIGTTLIAGESSSPWLSPSGDFAFGFQNLLNNKSLFLLCIWYDKIPDKTIVWYANKDSPSPAVPKNSKLDLTSDQGLVLSDPQGKEIQRISKSMTGTVLNGFLSDEGNFLLRDRSSETLWQSFDHPTDTILPTQILNTNSVLNSRRSETDFARGKFQLRLQDDGDLVMSTVNLPSENTNNPYFKSGTTGDNPGTQLVFNDTTGQLYVLTENGTKVSIGDGGGNLPSTSSQYYFRAKLEFDGVLTQYSYPKSGNGSWTLLWLEPNNICTAVSVNDGFGVCGFNSICRLREHERRPDCQCPKGYSMADPSYIYGDCVTDFVHGCKEDELVDRSKVDGDGLYDVEELINVDWPSSDTIKLDPSTFESCKQACLEDCLCSVAIFRIGTCWKKKLPLSNGKYDTSLNSVAFLKVRKPKYSSFFPNRTVDDQVVKEGKDQDGLILAGSVLLATSMFFNLLLVSAACVGFFFIYRKKKSGKWNADHSAMEMNLRCFTHKELMEATDGFKEEIGRGAFGIVYRGTLRIRGSVIPVAVKKLNYNAIETEKEFRNEVNIIGQTHHKNLVRLFGFCAEKQNRMLIYEFLSNGTLANYLFVDVKPSWKQRSETALGVAKGLMYLHEECTSQIIHCDIKPQNILIDEQNNPKISDFGLSKLLKMDQSQTNTAIRGTKGYVAPEWFRNTPVTAKVDVYSFGVVLLEMVCCRKNVDYSENCEEEKCVLTDWAYDCYREGDLEALVNYEAEALENRHKLEKFVMVSMWCIQENPSMRPTMRRVVQMLEGVVEVNVPPCPCPTSYSVSIC